MFPFQYISTVNTWRWGGVRLPK